MQALSYVPAQMPEWLFRLFSFDISIVLATEKLQNSSIIFMRYFYIENLLTDLSSFWSA
jgi:hypothetical protein